MAQNASYQYGNLATELPKPAGRNRRRTVRYRYKAAVWTKKERRLVMIFAFLTLTIMLGTVYTSVRTDALMQRNIKTQQKITQLKQDNDSLKGEIQSKINRQNLDDVAKKSKMEQSDNNVRNINQ